MSDQGDDHEKARELAEKALREYSQGNEAAGDKLVQQVEKIDPTVVDEVAENIDVSDGSAQK